MNQSMHRLFNFKGVRIFGAGIIGLALAAATTMAQEDERPAAPARYEVELIVFRHLDQGRNTPEIPAAGSLIHESPLTLIPAEDSATSFMSSLEFGVASPFDLTRGAEPGAGTGHPDEAVDDPSTPPVGFLLMDPRAEFPDFVPIDAESMALRRLYERLEQLGAYEPIAHLGWVQTAKHAGNATPYRMGDDPRDSSGVTGTITLYKERYLHLELELSLEENRADPQFFTREIIADMRTTGRMIHKLQESRRIRGANSHYFDHPLFGVIARIKKITVAGERENADPGAG